MLVVAATASAMTQTDACSPTAPLDDVRAALPAPNEDALLSDVVHTHVGGGGAADAITGIFSRRLAHGGSACEAPRLFASGAPNRSCDNGCCRSGACACEHRFGGANCEYELRCERRATRPSTR